MKSNKTLSSRGAAWWVLGLAALLPACGPETPPYEDLPLRDALRASPETLAALPEEARLDLALRLVDAQDDIENVDAIDETPARAGVPSAAALVRGADEAREAEGKDALVLGSIEPRGDDLFVVRQVALEELPGGGLDPASLEVPSDEAPSITTKALEDAALRGKAGAVLAALAQRAGADDRIRITGWPAGVIVVDRTVYVNASWLVAMSALEPNEAPSLAPAPALAVPKSPSLTPQSVGGNPYDLPISLDVCASDVRDTCACASSNQCSHEPADQTFADANAECAWVSADPLNAEALCVLALMSVHNVAQCVEKGSSLCVPVEDRDRALEFLLNIECRAHLDACLEDGKPASTESSGRGSCNGGSRGCDNSSCDNGSCNNSSCGSCNNGNCNTCSSSSCKTCRIGRGDLDSDPIPGAPWSDALMFLAPVAYMACRTRRRS
ncbi:MAG: hypothetical protein HUU21_31425 [Polyangiaceae bacterium]|nr:hypothetical protein [Polyangiaceae bacterium]